jgi:hypothetical protein
MKTRHVVLAVGALSVLVLGLAFGVWYVAFQGRWRPDRPFGSPETFNPSLEKGKVTAASDYRLSGPVTHDNLTVFLIHGPATLDGKAYLTLQEALEQRKAVVHETGAVGELAIENLSPNEEVYVQSGDIVKGGQQDRTFPYDFIAPTNSGRLPIESFCVEHGRWQGRGNESLKEFSSSANSLSSNSLKLAARSGREGRAQAEVWRNVDLTQQRLSEKLGASVNAAESGSSLQLSLENPRLRKAVAPYLSHLASAPGDKQDVIGAVFVVNGKVMSADVYASGALFRKLWPKLLESCAIEAVAEREAGPVPDAPSSAAVLEFLREAEGVRPTSEAVTDRVFVLTHEGGRQVLFDTCDRARDNLVIHRSYLAR